MDQIHKRFTVDQANILVNRTIKSTSARSELEKILQVLKIRFFAMLNEYRQDPAAFSIAYQLETLAYISPEVEAVIAAELLRQKGLIENPDRPIRYYNYFSMPIQTSTMQAAGDHQTMQLDINNYYVIFTSFEVHDGQLIAILLQPKGTVENAGRFLGSYSRDFFYVCLE